MSSDAEPSSREPAGSAPLIAVRNLTKAFPGVRALDGVDFTLRRGEIHSLMGENGAGKSTLIKVLTGVYSRDGGDIRLDGRSVNFSSPTQAQDAGISTVYQEVNLIPHLSVAENICLGRQPRRWGMINWREVRRRARAAVARLELDIDVTRPISTCSIAIQQMVAIGRALDVEAKALILDEPTSSLDRPEVQQLFAVLRRLRSQGLGIIFISHFMDQVYDISDRLTVLRNGQLVGEYEAAKLPRLELIGKMLGKDVSAVNAMQQHAASAADASHAGQVLVEAKQIGRRHAIAPMDLAIRRGEVVGLAGLLGSGRTELARLFFGLDRPDSGEMAVDGSRLSISSPRQAIGLGFAMVPEDRKVESILPDLSIRENIALALQIRRGWWRRLSGKAQRELADRFIAALGIATPDAEKPISQLSGGNQQKAILGRWLALQPRLLILDEPTRGIDVGAKAEIEKLIRRLCDEGMAILFISSELEEVARDCDRVVVLRDRRKVGELRGEEATVPAIMQVIAAPHEGQEHGG